MPPPFSHRDSHMQHPRTHPFSVTPSDASALPTSPSPSSRPSFTPTIGFVVSSLEVLPPTPPLESSCPFPSFRLCCSSPTPSTSDASQPHGRTITHPASPSFSLPSLQLTTCTQKTHSLPTGALECSCSGFLSFVNITPPHPTSGRVLRAVPLTVFFLRNVTSRGRQVPVACAHSRDVVAHRELEKG
eukprot:RCo003576